MLADCKAVVINTFEEGHRNFQCTLHRGCGFLYINHERSVIGALHLFVFPVKRPMSSV